MPLHWSAPRAAPFRDAYLDWSRQLSTRLDKLDPARPDGGTDYEPIFVRLAGSDRAARVALRDALQQSTTLLMDPHERDTLNRRIADTVPSTLPDEYALYRRVGTGDAEHAHLFTVIDTGVPVRLTDQPMAVTAPATVSVGPHVPNRPIIAIIDDGIGFLNRRFCGPEGTRFHAVWLQALESRSDQGGILSGLVLDRAAIDALRTEAEQDVYARLNAQVRGHHSRAASSLSRSHGTQVLDIAAGAEMTDPEADWPLLAVQLPPETVDDTSGCWFESYILQGLRWILRQAAVIDPQAPVIVNLSLGIGAGPKNGTRFAEYQLAREAASWEAATNQPVRLVWAFGNGNRNDLTAGKTLTAGERAEIMLRVQPDDGTASYVEIHTRAAASQALTVTVTPPGGESSGPTRMAPGQVRSLQDARGKIIGQLYHIPDRAHGDGVTEAAHLTLALAPTTPRKGAEPTAPAGAWTITVQSDVDATVLMMVQRDDALGGSLLRGRQAYFDAPQSYDWDTRTADYTLPGPEGLVKRAGCHNAMATTASRQCLTVGAANIQGAVEGLTPDAILPALYTATGCDWSLTGPSVSAICGQGPFSGGILASGTLTGSTRRVSGTSAATGVITRALGLSAARIKANATSDRSADLDPALCRLVAVPGGYASQLGSFVVIPRAPTERPQANPTGDPLVA